jgi:hypothetical protein
MKVLQADGSRCDPANALCAIEVPLDVLRERIEKSVKLAYGSRRWLPRDLLLG